MAQKSRVLTALSAGLRRFPAPVLDSSQSGESDTLFWPPGLLHTCVANNVTQAHIHTKKKFKTHKKLQYPEHMPSALLMGRLCPDHRPEKEVCLTHIQETSDIVSDLARESWLPTQTMTAFWDACWPRPVLARGREKMFTFCLRAGLHYGAVPESMLRRSLFYVPWGFQC